jgi:hypothetical protein
MCAGCADRSVDQSPAAVDPVRQERHILIFRLHDYAVAIEGAEILGKRRCHTQPTACVGNGGGVAHSDGRVFITAVKPTRVDRG